MRWRLSFAVGCDGWAANVNPVRGRRFVQGYPCAAVAATGFLGTAKGELPGHRVPAVARGLLGGLLEG